MTNKDRDIIEFRKYDTGEKAFYTLGNEEILMNVKCPFDKTPIVFGYEWDDFFCPNCKTNYDYTESQKNLDKQKKKALKNLRKEIDESEKAKNKHDLLRKLVYNSKK